VGLQHGVQPGDQRQPRHLARQRGQPIFAGSFGQARTAVGDPIGSWFVRQTCGVFQSDAAAQAHTTTLENGTVRVVQPSARAGDLCYSDVNGDGQATTTTAWWRATARRG
jgi:hypothetical protein